MQKNIQNILKYSLRALSLNVQFSKTSQNFIGKGGKWVENIYMRLF